MKRKVGVVLSGCGFLDGAEIREAVLTLLALDANDLEAVCIAPDQDQMHVVDHLTGEPVAGATRNVRVEAARIARGDVRDLAAVRADELDALVLPGGFGMAKNCSDFAVAGAAATVHPALAELLRAMHAAGKPIGAICIAPAVVAAVLGRVASPVLTIGDDEATAAALTSMGAEHRDSAVDTPVTDRRNRIVSVAAYMCDARLRDVSAGIHRLVASLVEMLDGAAKAEAGR
ncbi:MAG: isoprenoid biosynthesis glyoxalase ElbB [Planctomycetes bacterium]|nr:isoprenoid biosynthesis glyoxalase ElbB [Planctomycetota bacterium]